MNYMNKEELDKIIAEIAGYSVELEEDPTQPHLGYKYINQVLTKCRSYQNRVAYYLQQTKMQEKDVKNKIRILKTNIEMKSNDKLANDAKVRQKPNIHDRKALVANLLADEYTELNDLELILMEVEETYKLVKMQYEHLKQTTRDIQLQRIMIKDDKDVMGSGGDGYSKPSAPGGVYENGMKPVVTAGKKMPTIPLKDGVKSPLPKPVDEEHSKMIRDFIAKGKSHPPQKVEDIETEEEEIQEVPTEPGIEYQDILI